MGSRCDRATNGVSLRRAVIAASGGAAAGVLGRRSISHPEPAFSVSAYDSDLQALYNDVRGLDLHADPKFIENGFMGNIMSRQEGNVAEMYAFNFHESGDPYWLEGVMRMLEPYALYFQGKGRLSDGTVPDPTKYREFRYTILSESPLRISLTGDLASGYVDAAKQWWWRADQGLAPIGNRDTITDAIFEKLKAVGRAPESREQLAFRPAAEARALANRGFLKAIYWRPNTVDKSDLPMVGSGIGHGLDYPQLWSWLMQGTKLAAHNLDFARAPGRMPVREIFETLWDANLDQFEMMAFRGRAFYPEHGMFGVGHYTSTVLPTP